MQCSFHIHLRTNPYSYQPALFLWHRISLDLLLDCSALAALSHWCAKPRETLLRVSLLRVGPISSLLPAFARFVLPYFLWRVLPFISYVLLLLSFWASSLGIVFFPSILLHYAGLVGLIVNFFASFWLPQLIGINTAGSWQLIT